MTVDIRYTTDKETVWDQTGDIGTVDGKERVEQGCYIRIVENVDLNLTSATPSAIETQRQAIEQVVRDTDVTQEPIDVSVVERPQQADAQSSQPVSVGYQVTTARIRFTFEPDELQ